MNTMFVIQLIISAILGVASSILYPGFKSGSYSSIFLAIIFISIFLMGKGFGELCTAMKLREDKPESGFKKK
ncbi:hypothetical protein FDG95_gp556 [Pectobacterium phage vB_PcaM_CBB]|uniref:Uncharacterized protein n=1 Tax=Pectobacterium phage vB_PcaM_CBB TaxID=2772511 RepID=A0A1L2CVG2_9CAUD|nr:hypothetical protein FDG95_gp556 [Pectobacterium phage vB_PcaM_CBB]AMM43986.1 hypothetical protein CBB_423 [Pectobacterium phage vB_PcaM_CBB]